MATDSEVAAGMKLLSGLICESGKLNLIEARPLGGARFAYHIVLTAKETASKQTDFVISNKLLTDLSHNSDLQLAARTYIRKTARRMANPHPMDVYCKMGVPIRIETEWPFQPVAGRAASYMHVSVHDLRHSTVAIVSVSKTHQQEIFDCRGNPFFTEAAIVNTIRKAVDAKRITFYPRGSHPANLETLELDTSLRGTTESEAVLARFLLGKAYLMGFRQGDRRTKVWITDDEDADYLGTNPRTLLQTAQTLEAQKWIVLDSSQTYASAGDRLLSQGAGLLLDTAHPPKSSDALAVATAPGSHEYDAFICHASEDKAGFARPLAEKLRGDGFRVWYDEFELSVGDSLRRKIDEGLRKSRYGIVVLSPAFFAKEWPQWELDGLVAREMEGKKVILPIWHHVTAADVRKYSPSLSEKLAANSADGLDVVISKLASVIRS